MPDNIAIALTQLLGNAAAGYFNQKRRNEQSITRDQALEQNNAYRFMEKMVSDKNLPPDERNRFYQQMRLMNPQLPAVTFQGMPDEESSGKKIKDIASMKPGYVPFTSGLTPRMQGEAIQQTALDSDIPKWKMEAALDLVGPTEPRGGEEEIFGGLSPAELDRLNDMYAEATPELQAYLKQQLPDVPFGRKPKPGRKSSTRQKLIVDRIRNLEKSMTELGLTGEEREHLDFLYQLIDKLDRGQPLTRKEWNQFSSYKSGGDGTPAGGGNNDNRPEWMDSDKFNKWGGAIVK